MFRIYFFAWFPMTVIAIVNGMMREYLYRDFIGELAAHQVSTFILILLFAIYIYALVRKWSFASSRQALGIGCMWLAMTIAFEFGFGHYVAGHPWDVLFADYNLFAGRLWALIPLWVLTAPLLMYRLRRRIELPEM